MKAEDFRTLKTKCVYSTVELTYTNEFTQDHTEGDYRLVTIGVMMRLIEPELSVAGSLVSAWNSMVRNNQWSSRATDKNVSLSDLPISKASRKILSDIRAGRINKTTVNEKYSKNITDWREIHNYITALYFSAQVYKDPLARFKQALSSVIGESNVNGFIRAATPYAPLDNMNTYEVRIHADTEKVKPIDIVGIPLLVKYRDEAEDGTRYVPFVICQNSKAKKLAKNEALYDKITSRYSANTPQGCLKHLRKINNATDICWFV